MPEEMITITKKLYDGLQRDSDFLRALEGAGVDNWEGYDYAIESLEAMKAEANKT